MNLEERIALLEFQVKLLYNNSPSDRFVFESKITHEQYIAIMDLMDSIRNKLENGQSVHHYEFEQNIYNLIPEKDGDYHFCEIIAQLFAEEGRWEEVFPALYGDMPKYNELV